MKLFKLRDMENELEEEKKQRAMAINARKKLEADLKQMEQQFEIVSKVKDDSVKQLRKLQVINYSLSYSSLTSYLTFTDLSMFLFWFL